MKAGGENTGIPNLYYDHYLVTDQTVATAVQRFINDMQKVE